MLSSGQNNAFAGLRFSGLKTCFAKLCKFVYLFVNQYFTPPRQYYSPELIHNILMHFVICRLPRRCAQRKAIGVALPDGYRD